MKVTAIILAGGKSSRFGKDKTLLMWRGQSMMEHLVQQCLCMAEEVLIVGNKTDKFRIKGAREVTDRFPSAGPMGGVHAGLEEASHEIIFVTACDMPFFYGNLARKLISFAGSYEAAVPVYQGRIQPLFSMMRREPALKEAVALLRQNQRAMGKLFEKLHTVLLDESRWSDVITTVSNIEPFYNINYPADYERFAARNRKEDNG